MSAISVIKLCIGNAIHSCIRSNNRYVYYFKYDNSDYLSLPTYFTGRFTAIIAGTDITGINEKLLLGLTDTWENSTNVLTKPIFNKFELDVTDLLKIVDETFDGVLIYSLDGEWNDLDSGYGYHTEIYNELENSWSVGKAFPSHYSNYNWYLGDESLLIDDEIVVSRGI